MIQLSERFWFHSARWRWPDVFVHFSAVERAELSTLNEGQRVSFDIAHDHGRTNAANLKLA
jgi:CspA family cold shock protein